MKNENSTRIKYSKLFNKQHKAIPLVIKKAFRDAFELFLEYPNHPVLRNHGLKQRFQGYRSIDITEDYRAIYKEKHDGNEEIITFYMIGTHEELYGK